MKTRLSMFLLFSLILAGPLKAVEPFRGDTVRIQLKNVWIDVISSDFNKHKFTEAKPCEIASEIENWLNFAEVAKPLSDEMIYIGISENEGQQQTKNITFENRKRDKKSIVISDGKILEKDFGNYLIEFKTNEYTYRYYLNDLQSLNTISKETFSQQIAEVEKLIPSGRKKINAWLIQKETGKFETHFLDENDPKTLDMIYITAGVGAGVIKNQWVNDINFKIGLGFANKGFDRNLYFAEFKMYYDFPGASAENNFSINSFVSLGWEHNFSKNLDNKKWFGMSLGYLVDRNSDFFEKNTWKFAIHKRINQTISVSPELYFNDSFKNIQPGVQIGIVF